MYLDIKIQQLINLTKDSKNLKVKQYDAPSMDFLPIDIQKLLDHIEINKILILSFDGGNHFHSVDLKVEEIYWHNVNLNIENASYNSLQSGMNFYAKEMYYQMRNSANVKFSIQKFDGNLQSFMGFFPAECFSPISLTLFLN
jgi:hypothetical protein